ncbi:MAG TPA: hypothetical protein VFD32_14420 [Dehalococcoidia bacterium]|nr:hypothetical protein [Dehalococcoidia bacterium]
MPGLRGRYHALLDALDAWPAEQATLRLPVTAIEALIGGPLPRTAAAPEFWTSSHTARKNWQRLGWSARRDRADGAIVFTRRCHAAAVPGRYGAVQQRA